MMRRVTALLFVAIFVAMFFYARQLPPRRAEATAALATVETCHRGDAIASHQLGELEPARLPLHKWLVRSAALGEASRVSVPLARSISTVAIVLAALVAGAAFGGTRWRIVAALGLATPAIWAAALRGTPGALLAMLLTLAWAAYEGGRRLGTPTLQWALPTILGAAASLVWSPAILLVALALLVEAVRLSSSRTVSWLRLGAGVLGAVTLIGMWQMAYAGFSPDASGWWERVLHDLTAGDPVLAERWVGARVLASLGALLPAAVLVIIRRGKTAGESIGLGVVVAACATVALAALAPGVPSAVTIPAGWVAVALCARGRRVGDPPSPFHLEGVVLLVLVLLSVAVVAHYPRGRPYLDRARLEEIDGDLPVVIDRALDPRETWLLVQRLGRPAVRRAPYSSPTAWFIGPAEAGPGIAIDGPRTPEAWSLMGRPLERPPLPGDTRETFQARLAEARDRLSETPADALASIWVGRRLGYLGRYREAIDWYRDAGMLHAADARIWRHRGHRLISVRELDRAIADLERAVELERDRDDRVEPDGMPNAAGIPTSTTQTNIWYHLGLAHYLKGDLEQTARCYREYLARSNNDDSFVAGAHWLHIALRRLGRDAEARELLTGLRDDMKILENASYHDLVQLYAGELDAFELQQRLDQGDGPGQAALAYGLARWYDDQGEHERAREAYRRIVAEAGWASFGSIAAEAELAHRLRRETPVW